MSNWFNPRVVVVAISIIVLAQVSKLEEPHQTIRRGCIACGAMLVLYGLAFVLPLGRTLGLRRIVVPLLSLIAAWSATALAMIADALPVSLDEQMTRRFNLPMVLACVAGAAAFYLFFENSLRGFRLRADVLEARRGAAEVASSGRRVRRAR